MTVSLCNNSLDTPRSGGENFNNVFKLISPDSNTITPPLVSNTILLLSVNNLISPLVIILVDMSFIVNVVVFKQSNLNPVFV